MLQTLLVAPDAHLEFTQVLKEVRPRLTPNEASLLDFVLSGDCRNFNDMGAHLSLSRERARIIFETLLSKVERVTNFSPRFRSWNEIEKHRRSIVEHALRQARLAEERIRRAAEFEKLRAAKYDSVITNLILALTHREIVLVSSTLPEPFATQLLNRLVAKNAPQKRGATA